MASKHLVHQNLFDDDDAGAARRPSMGGYRPAPDTTKYVKFLMNPFTKVKHMLFYSDSKMFTEKLATDFYAGMNLKRPNLIITGCSGVLAPRYCLSQDELNSPELQHLLEETKAETGQEELVREIISMRLKKVMEAMLSAIEATDSMILQLDVASDSFALLVAAALASGGADVTNMVAFHANDRSILPGGATQTLIGELFDKAVPFTADAVENFTDPVMVDGTCFTSEESGFLFSKPLTANGLYGEDGQLLPEGERKMISQWCDPESGDIYLIFCKVDPLGKLAFEPQAPICHNPIPHPSVFGPLGVINLNGTSNVTKAQYLECFERAYPSVIVNHTGSQANMMAQVILRLQRVIDDDLGTLKQLVADESAAKKGLTLAHRIALVKPSLLLEQARKSACNDGARFTVADMTRILDLCKIRPQVFTETIKVIDPMVHTPEQCLDILSSCFSSAYTGMQELGSSTTEIDVVHKAWQLHDTISRKAGKLYWMAVCLDHTASLVGWLAILCSIFVLLEENAVFRTCVIGLPVLGGLINTFSSHFQSRTKWGRLELASARLVREIYLFRGKVGPYNPAKVHKQSEGDTEPQQDLSASSKSKIVRTRFVHRITSLSNDVISGSLSNNSIAIATVSHHPLIREKVANYIAKSLYGHEHSATHDDFNQGAAAQHSSFTAPSKQPPPLCSILTRQTSTPLLTDYGSSKEDFDVFTDNGINPMTTECYFVGRLQPLIAKLGKDAPRLHMTQDVFNVGIFILGFIASLLAAFKFSLCIPAVISLSALLAGINTFHGSSQRLVATNSAIATLASLETQWLSMGNMDRRTPHFKELLIMKTEQCVMSVTSTAVGFSLLTEGEDNENEVEGTPDGSDTGSQKKKKKTGNLGDGKK